MFSQFLGEHGKLLRQHCSSLNQNTSVLFRDESVFFINDSRENQLFPELIQHCSKVIRVYSTERNNVLSFSS